MEMWFPQYKEMSVLYVCVLPATEELKFSDKEHLILMVWLTCPDKNEIAVSQSYFTIAGL